MKRQSFFLILILLLFIVAACSGQQAGLDRQATVSALGTLIVGKATQQKSESTPDNSVENALSTATAFAVSVNATQTAESSAGVLSQQATDTAFAPFKAQLGIYGVDPNKGQPAWIHPPLTLETSDFKSMKSGNDFPATIVKNFLVQTDLTMDTDFGTAGCGFIFRTDGDQNKPSGYIVLATRGLGGHIVFAVLSKGELAGGTDFYASGIDQSFNADKGGKNTLTVVANGPTFEIYTNGTLLGVADPNAPLQQPKIPPPPPTPTNLKDPTQVAGYNKAKAEYDANVTDLKSNFTLRLNNAKDANKTFDSGFLAMVAASESGHTLCQFDNTFLWQIEP
jgi:hypothetical protein